MVTIHLAMYSYEISFDQHTYDGVPISTMSRFVNEISFDQHMMESPYLRWSIWYLDEISFDQSTFGDGVPISTDGESCRFMNEIIVLIGMGSPYIYNGEWYLCLCMRYPLINIVRWGPMENEISFDQYTFRDPHIYNIYLCM